MKGEFMMPRSCDNELGNTGILRAILLARIQGLQLKLGDFWHSYDELTLLRVG
jgi:hypothetical protein